MSGGARTLFFGLIGIVIALSASFVIYREQLRRTRGQREDAAEKAPATSQGRSPAPKRAGADRR